LDKSYIFFEKCPPYEARQLLDAFVKNGIRFEVVATNPPPPVSTAGRCGIDAGVSVAVHSEDVEKAARVRVDIFKIQV